MSNMIVTVWLGYSSRSQGDNISVNDKLGVV